MNETSDLQRRIEQYLAEVSSNLRGTEADERQDILEGIELHIHDALKERCDGEPDMATLEAVLGEMDAPQAYRAVGNNSTPAKAIRRGRIIPTVIWVALVSCIAGFFIQKILTRPISPGSYAAPAEGRMEKGLKRVHPEDEEPTVFVDDPKVHGRWVSVDFVDAVDTFDPAHRQMPGDLYLKELEFLPDGKMGRPWMVWSGGQVYHRGDKTIAHYIIKNVGGKDYLFYEWMSGDVIFRGRLPMFYVLTRDED